MAEGRRYTPTGPLDINQILSEAQNRWLRPVEICEILQNYRKFRIAPEPPNRPPSGSLFLFDRKQLRYFRKDGHNWRKKKDGKTVKEAHERLKAGSVDVLHCYYAHGEENENFQRRSYWMLEEDLMHIVLVHYREVKGSRTSSSRGREAEEIMQSPSLGSSPASSNFPGNYDQSHSQTTDTSSLTSPLMSELEDPDSDNHQASSRYHSYTELQQYDDGLITNQIDVGLFNNYHSGSSSVNNPGDFGVEQSPILGINYASVPQRNIAKEISDGGFELNFSEPDKKIAMASSWEGILEQCSIDSLNLLHPSTQPVGMIGQVYVNEVGLKEANIEDLCNQPEWQVPAADNCNLPMWPVDLKMPSDSACPQPAGFETELSSTCLPTSTESASIESDRQMGSPLPNEIQSISDNSSVIKADTGGSNDRLMEVKRSLLGEEGLKKLDSFSRWMSKELGEVHEAHALSTSAGIWTSVEGGDAIEVSTFSAQDPLDEYLLSPSLSQDQLFSIFDFSPNWTFTDVEAKVLVFGTFLKTNIETENYRWSCMFGEIEVPAEVLGEGILRCSTPSHKAGLVPFYVTCSNRLACSEIREFEYRVCQDKSIDTIDTSADKFTLIVRLGKLLSLGLSDSENIVSGSLNKYHEEDKMSSPSDGNAELLAQMLKITSEGGFILDGSKEQSLQNLFIEQLPKWLLQKMTEDGKGPNILDKEGQGVIHLVSALGYDWAIEPIVAAGVNINFRDVHGWTALHWAASYGRLRTVATLVSMGAFTGALTDPTPQYTSGRTPADLASSNGHKGIGGYLAESSLTTHLSNLTLKEGLKDGNQLESSGTKAIQIVAERSPVQHGVDDVPDGLSLKDSLTAVCNAEQAAARIHQVFRVQSFQRKQVIEYGDDKFDISDERTLSLIAMKSKYPGRHDLHAHDAAIRIQNKFRGWKGRREFLIMRQKIVKIQALVRGHQVRKKYKNVIWSVGIVEKAILRWRRKGSGLRGFRSNALNDGPSMQIESAKDDDYEFLREGRRQTEARLDKALARVRSMVQYPEARDQYRRLLTVVNEIQERKVFLNESDVNMNDDMFDLDALLEDDAFMPTAT